MNKLRKCLPLLIALAIMLVLTACHKASTDEAGVPDGAEKPAVTEPSGDHAAVPPAENGKPEDGEPGKEPGKAPENNPDGSIPEDGTPTGTPTKPETTPPEMNTPAPQTGTTEPPAESGQGEEQPKADDNADKLARIDELKNQVYDLRADYQGQLKGLESAAADEYLAIPKEERTEDKRTEIALRYYNSALELEGECDAKIDAICAELQLLLIQTGGDETIVREIRSEYNAEKESLKSKYMDSYGEYLG